MFWHTLLTISLLSLQRTWSLPFPGQFQASQGQLLETMDLRDIVRSVGSRHEAVFLGNQQKSGYHNSNLKFLENIGMSTQNEEQANHLSQLELDENAGTHYDIGNVPLLHSPSGHVNDVLEDIRINQRGRQSNELEKKKNNNQNLGMLNAITDIGLGAQSGAPDKSQLVQISSNYEGTWRLLPPGILNVPGMEFTPEQMEEISETGRLCTEDGECVYFSGGWGQSCCPFG